MYDLLTRQDQKRMDIFKYLYSNNHTTIKQVAQELDVAIATVGNVIQDAINNNESLKSQIIEENGQINVIELDLNIVLNYYLKNSVMFEMIRSLIKTGTISQERFEKDLFISQPTFSRNRTRLKQILSRFQIELNARNELEGSEYVIRKFFYYFYTNTSGYIPLDQNDVSARMHKLFTAVPFLKTNDHSRYNKIYRLLRISSYRIRQKNYIDQDIYVNEKISPLIKGMLKNVSNYITSHEISAENKYKETKYFIYTLYREYISDFDLSSEELVKLFEVPDATFNNVEKYIVDSVIEEISFPDKLTPEVDAQINELVNRFHLEMLYGLVDRSFFEVVEINRKSLFIIENKIVDEAEKIYEQLSNNDEYRNWVLKNKINVDKDMFITQIFFLLYKVKIFKAKSDEVIGDNQKIKIMIQMSHPEIERFVKTRFELLFWNQVIFVNDVFKDPDFIIADIIQPEYKGTKTYQLASIPTIEQTESIMINLSHNVLDIFLKRII